MPYPELDTRMLAYALSSKRLMMTMSSAVTIDYFSRDCQMLWELVRRAFMRFRELPTERVLIAAAGEHWEKMKDLHATVAAQEVDPREYPLDMERFRVRYNEQVVRKAGEEVFNHNFNGETFADLQAANRVLQDAMSRVSQIYSVDVFKEGSLAEAADESWRDYQEVERNPGKAVGIKTGFAEFDRVSNGLREAEIMLIGGQSGTGKSALAMNMAVNAWLGENKVPENPEAPIGDFSSGISVLYFTIEMPFAALKRRLDACVAGVPLYGIRDGSLNDEEKRRYRAALRFMRAYPSQFRIIDIPRGATMQHIESKFMQCCDDSPDNPPQLVVVDYISLMESDRDQGSDWRNLGRIAEQYHEFTRVNRIPSISPVQLNRPDKKASQSELRPDQERIARSSMLVDNANIVLTIEKRKDEHLQKDMKIHRVKMRDGEQGMFVLQKRLDMMRLYDDIPGWEAEEYEETKDGA